MRPSRIRALIRFAALCCGLPSARAQSPAPPPPNIVILLADDLGWREAGYNGGSTPTPRIDALAASGARLTQFYAQYACTPSRAALLTGRYPSRYGLQSSVIQPVSKWGLPPEERTLAEALREAGYRTSLVGKWHLGHADPAYLPMSRGFDSHYGPLVWGVDYYTHETQGALDWRRDGKPLAEKGYATDLIAAEAVRQIERRDPAKPLFLFVSFTAPHVPLMPPPRFDERAERRAAAEQARKERESGAGPGDVEKLYLRRVRSAMIANLDANIGAVLDAIARAGIERSTLVVFLSDNGGDVDSLADNGDLRGSKATHYEGGVRVPAAVAWPGRIPAGSACDAMLHLVDLYPTLLRLGGAKLDQPLPIDGRDAWGAIAQGGPPPREELLLGCVPSGAALRVGEWKLVTSKAKPSAPELYNLREDPRERTNLAPSNPEKTKELADRLAAYVRQMVPPKFGPDDLKPAAKIPKAWGAAATP